MTVTDYEREPAETKLDYLWGRVVSDAYEEGVLPVNAPGGWKRRRLFSVGYNRISFEHVSDELPEGREKLLHRHGCVARVRLDITHPQASGLLGTGGSGLMRLSDATGGGVLTPALALKLPVDGRPSQNFFALPMQHRDPKDPSFWSVPLSNAAPPPRKFDAKLLAGRFEATTQSLGATRAHAIYLPLHGLASIGADGVAIGQAVVPDRLELHASPEAQASHDPSLDWRVSAAQLTAGTCLYEVRLAATLEEAAVPVGAISLASELVASRYGDERLFFQHDVGPRA